VYEAIGCDSPRINLEPTMVRVDSLAEAVEVQFAADLLAPEPLHVHGAPGRAELSNFFGRRLSAYEAAVPGSVAFDNEF
jgi:hypothetical protein